MLTIKLKSLQLKDGDTLLDLGCGEGRHLHAAYYQAKIHALGLDLGFDDLAKARKGFEDYPDPEDTEPRFGFVQGDALKLPFPDASIDKLICSEVLEHLPDYPPAIDEIWRITKPGALLGISVPRYWTEWVCWKLSDQYPNSPGGHVRIFKPEQLKTDFTSRGFEFLDMHHAHGLHSPYWWLKCAMWDKRDNAWIIRQYHKFLVWDITKRPPLTRALEAVADPLMGKSIVFYFKKPEGAA